MQILFLRHSISIANLRSIFISLSLPNGAQAQTLAVQVPDEHQALVMHVAPAERRAIHLPPKKQNLSVQSESPMHSTQRLLSHVVRSPEVQSVLERHITHLLAVVSQTPNLQLADEVQFRLPPPKSGRRKPGRPPGRRPGRRPPGRLRRRSEIITENEALANRENYCSSYKCNGGSQTHYRPPSLQ